MSILNRRLNIVFAIIIIIGLGLVLGLFKKQVLQNNYYTALAKKQYTVTKDLVANRGEIFVYDQGETEPQKLATNLHFYDLLMVPKNIKNPKEVARKLSGLRGMTEKEIYDQINNNKPYIPPVKKKIDTETAKKIEDLNINGVMLVPNMWRYYPENNLASFVLGFVDAEGEGRYGLEGYYNQELKGTTNQIDVEKDFFNSNNFLLSNEKAFDGSDLYLSIDRTIQYIAEQKIKEAVAKNQAGSGSILIMDPKTGKILAMAGSADFNPNLFFEQKSVDIFNNPNTVYPWEPGSIFKPIIMAAAIDTGEVQPDTEGVFGSSVKVGSYTIKTSTGEAYGRETMTQVLENSDNVAMVWLGNLLGKEILYKYVRDFGFGQKTQIDLDGETPGEIPELKNWRPINLATASFGQGISTTPIQIATAYSAIANKGNLMQPEVVEKIVGPNNETIVRKPKIVRRIISEETAKKITEMMISVVERGHGKKARVAGYWVAGKTGTAQIPDPDKAGYLEDANIGSFAGFAPAHDPKFAMIVKIDRPKNVEWAESSAAPVFGEMAEWLLNYYQVPKER